MFWCWMRASKKVFVNHKTFLLPKPRRMINWMWVSFSRLNGHLKESKNTRELVGSNLKKIQTVTNKFNPLKWFLHVRFIINQGFFKQFCLRITKMQIPSWNVCSSLSICITLRIQKRAVYIYTFDCDVCSEKYENAYISVHIQILHMKNHMRLFDKCMLIIKFKYEASNQKFILKLVFVTAKNMKMHKKCIMPNEHAQIMQIENNDKLL